MEIGTLEQEILLEETHALLATLHDPQRRAPYAALLAGLESGSVPDDAVGALALLRVFQKTPRGAAVVQATATINQALGALRGVTLQNVAFTARAPGVYGLTLDTNQGQFSLRIQREGVWLENIEVEL
jgi:hypothetical protein